MSIPPPTKKRKIVAMMNLEKVLELALPFVAAKDLFEGGICSVNKNTHGRCIQVLHDQCQKEHPILWKIERENLTYIKFRSFGRSEDESRERPWTKAEYEAYFLDYQVILEIKDLRNGRVLASDICGLNYSVETGYNRTCDKLRCYWDVPPFEIESNWDWDRYRDPPEEKLMHVRVIVRKKSTGKMATLVDADQASGFHSHSLYQNYHEGNYMMIYTSSPVAGNRLIAFVPLLFQRLPEPPENEGGSTFRYCARGIQRSSATMAFTAYQYRVDNHYDNADASLVRTAMENLSWR